MARYGGATMDTIGSTRSSSSARMTETSDRRSVGQTKIAKGALLFFGESSGVYACTVHDVTNSGAGIQSQGLKVIPLEFALSFDNFRSARMCRLVWRQGNFFGAALKADRPCKPRNRRSCPRHRSKPRLLFPANRENNRESARFSLLPRAEKREERRCHRGFLQSHWTNLTGKFETVFREDILQNRESALSGGECSRPVSTLF